ncbi:fused DSP-PTPase phosphatase/NAD kinase-like protein [Pseudidiomarina homiensis]|uniref:Serine/threonine protein phosphatase n=1 Tax=Pseudidiomarina homiensis TaxID=364198 RepID=A0A432XXZ8_9GAMM|nr:sulfur transferase domain-containing protein [Pseudidiomarina homiensis]RUO53589.1 serine/threonine protein phosphatase [Pseudidiomarina homiensis]
MKLAITVVTLSLVVGLSGCATETTPQPSAPAAVAVSATASEIYNFAQPAPNHLAGGQPKKNEIAALANSGVDAVINLRSHAEMNAINEAEWTTANQMAYYHIPIAGADGLTKANVQIFHQTLQNTSEQTVFMHCASSNRVGAMMALRAAWHQGASKAEALAIGERYGMTSLRKRVEELLSH